MVGLTGLFGGEGESVRRLAADLQWSDQETSSTFVDDHVGVHVTHLPDRRDDQPVATEDGDALVWLLGELFGYDGESGYVPRADGTDSVELCAALYDRHGPAFLERLNGHFAGVVYDREREAASVFTDRFGTQAVFRARPDGRFAFSTQLQPLALHGDVDPTFDREYLFEYLTFRHVFGVETPLQGIDKLPPASVTTYDLATGTVDRERYWEPQYRPEDRPFEDFVDEFVETFETVIGEWLDREHDVGVLLSGGSDSRLVLAAADQPVTAFHLSDWWSEETRIAERAARTAGAEFRLLQRTDDYYPEALEKNASLSNFDGYFFQGYLTPFEDEVTGSVDRLMTGLYADTLFKGHALPERSVSFGGLGPISLPLLADVDSIQALIEHWIDDTDGSLPDPPAYLDVPRDMHAVLRRNLTRSDGRIDHHGVEYDSLEDLIVAGHYYPLANDTELIFTHSLQQLVPHRTPFLDNRLVDLHLSMPLKYRLRRNLIKQAVARLDPELAAIPHASTGVSLSQSFSRQYLGRKATAFRRKYLPFDSPPKEYLEHGPWRNRAEFAGQKDFVMDRIRANEATVRVLPFLDWEGVQETYETHLRGENRTAELYTLLTFLEMPVTNAVAAQFQERAPETPEQVFADGGRREWS
jgi:asparagine synthase (glutamine-hydrolysing)